VLDKEQHVQAAQQHRVSMEEIGREDRLGLDIQERRQVASHDLPGGELRSRLL
jgi:hypothetical protein